MVRHTTTADDESTDDETTPDGDTVLIRTDDGIIHATVDEVVESDRPDDGARLGGTAEVNDPAIHYVDYYHDDGEDADEWAEDRGMTGDEDVVPAGKVGFEVDAVAAAWELADGVTPSVGAYVASCFATDDAGNYFGLAPEDGEFTDRDAHFADVEGGDGNTYDVMVEEKAVGIVDDDVDVPGRCYKVDIPGRDGKALYVAPPQIFVGKVHDGTAP